MIKSSCHFIATYYSSWHWNIKNQTRKFRLSKNPIFFVKLFQNLSRRESSFRIHSTDHFYLPKQCVGHPMFLNVSLFCQCPFLYSKTLWHKGLSFFISSFKFFDFGLSITTKINENRRQNKHSYAKIWGSNLA